MSNFNAQSVANNLTPLKGEGDLAGYDPRALGVSLNFAGGVVEIDGDLLEASQDGQLQFVQAIWIDNSLNASLFELTLTGSGQKIRVLPGCQGVVTAFSITPLNYKAVTAGGVVVQIQFLNFPCAPFMNGPITAPAGGIIVTPVLNGGALTSKSGALAAGGVSQVFAAANPARKTFNVYNPTSWGGVANNEILYVRFGAAATVDDGQSYEILPGGEFSPEDFGGFVPTDSINVNAVTIGHKFTGNEG